MAPTRPAEAWKRGDELPSRAQQAILIMSGIERFSDTLPDRARPRLPAGGDCPEKVLRSRSVEQLRRPRFLYGRRVALTPAGIAGR